MSLFTVRPTEALGADEEGFEPQAASILRAPTRRQRNARCEIGGRESRRRAGRRKERPTETVPSKKGAFESEPHPAVRQQGDAVPGERGTQHVAGEGFLAGEVVAPGEGGGVQGEAHVGGT